MTTENKLPIHIRVSEEKDIPLLKEWLFQPGVLRWFPMFDEREVNDSARIWISYAKREACFTIEWEGEPCGIANLYIQPFEKLKHQCLFAVIVSEKYRGKGVGTALLTHLIKTAKEKFHLEILHLEVYEGNPAIHLYQRLGFQQYGLEKKFIKDNGEYINKIMMQKHL